MIKAKIVYMVASDAIVEKKENHAACQTQKLLLKVHVVVVQNDFQQNQFINNIGKHTLVLQPNIYDFTLFKKDVSTHKSYDFIWVGNIKSLKQPNWFVQLAKQLPEYSFAMVGAIQEQGCFNSIRNDLHTTSNLNYLGYLSIHETVRAISKARILVNTSKYEGFPNTFLQAWSMNIPVLATVNPSKVIEDQNVGWYARNLEDLVAIAGEAMSNQKLYEDKQKSIKHYFLSAHSPNTGFNKLKSYLEN